MTFRPALAAVWLCAIAAAQDTRKVTEPRLSPACSVIPAQLPESVPESDETKLDTERIQRAIDSCAAGQGVVLEAGGGALRAFLSGPLNLRSGVTLIVGKGVTLYASRDPRLFDVKPGTCGIVTESSKGCKPLIAADRIVNAGVMGEGTIDGRGGEHLLGQKVSWWDLAQTAKVTNKNQNCPRLLVISKSTEFTLYKITLKNSPNFHVTFSGNGFTAWGVIINTPKTARNTDGIDPGNATNVTITHCLIHTGDDNVAIKAGLPGPTSHMTISHNHFYTGHGMSIGSETDGGASAILVQDLSIDGADNGLRIKSNVSRGGLVEGVVYEDVCIRNTKNPIYMDSNYSVFGEARNKLPQFRGIEFHNIRNEGAGKLTLDGLDEAHRLGLSFDNVMVDPHAIKITARHARIQVGPGPVNFQAAGEDVEVAGGKGAAAKGSLSCEAKFVPMPGR